MMKAIYVWKKADKSLDLNLMTPICVELANELGWNEYTIFSDGWQSPSDWEELTGYLESEQVSGVIFYSIEHLRNSQFKTGRALPILAKFVKANVPIYIAQARHLGAIVNNAGVKRVEDLLKAGDYYKSIKSESIRQGMLKRKGGRAPFGMEYGSEGELHPTGDYPLVVSVVNLNNQGLSISEISKRTELSYQKVRSIVAYWKDRKLNSISS